MKRILLLTSICLLSTAFAFAQYGGQPSTSSNQSTTTSTQSSTSDSPVSLQGCLSGSEGSYSLTDRNSGRTFHLTGNTSGLQAEVGQTIQLNGTSTTHTSSTSSTASGSQPSSMSGTGSNSPSTNTFQVSSFKHVSPTCDSAQH